MIGKYTVQIASYTNETEATEHASTLKKKGFSAFYLPANVNGKDWFRVSIGVFTSTQQAVIYRKKYVTETKNSTAIIQKIAK